MMNERFNQYLGIILIIIALISAVPVFLLLRSRKRRKRTGFVPIHGGSAGVFFDRSGNVVIIPYVKDRYGSGRATAQVVFLRAPFTAGKLGALLRNSLKSCLGDVPCETAHLMELLGVKEWNDFTAGRRNVSVHFKENRGVVFSPTRNNGSGGFEFFGRRQEKVLKQDAADRELGETLLEVARYCR